MEGFAPRATSEAARAYLTRINVVAGLIHFHLLAPGTGLSKGSRGRLEYACASGVRGLRRWGLSPRLGSTRTRSSFVLWRGSLDLSALITEGHLRFFIEHQRSSKFE